MHEMAICESIRDIVEDYAARNGARRVRVVRLNIGALSCVEHSALHFCFAAVARGTIACDATLDIVVTPGEGWCWDCEKPFVVSDRVSACPECGGLNLHIQGGDNMNVAALEID